MIHITPNPLETPERVAQLLPALVTRLNATCLQMRQAQEERARRLGQGGDDYSKAWGEQRNWPRAAELRDELVIEVARSDGPLGVRRVGDFPSLFAGDIDLVLANQADAHEGATAQVSLPGLVLKPRPVRPARELFGWRLGISMEPIDPTLPEPLTRTVDQGYPDSLAKPVGQKLLAMHLFITSAKLFWRGDSGVKPLPVFCRKVFSGRRERMYGCLDKYGREAQGE